MRATTITVIGYSGSFTSSFSFDSSSNAKPRRKLVGKVCPSCGSATYGEERKTCLSLGCWDSEGGMKKIGDWDIECASCEASWSGDQVSWLLRALDTPGIVVAEVAEVA